MKTPRCLSCLLLILSLTGCVRTIVIHYAADALSDSGGVFTSDDDPELIREALPIALKTNEALIAAEPGEERLLLSAASGFTQYAYAFVEADAERLDEKDPEAAKAALARARKLFRRARGYGMRALEAHSPGFRVAFERDRRAAVRSLERDAVPLLYWTGAAWAAEIAISKNDAKLLGELPHMEALMNRALELDESFSEGAIHEFFVSYDGRAESAGGSLKRARVHFDRAAALSHGKKLSLYVTWAETDAVARQDKKEFTALLDRVLAFDVNEAPAQRLVNILAQERARRLKARMEDLFAD